MHAIASSQPPPSAKPWIAAIDGLPIVSSAREDCWPLAAKAARRLGVERGQLVDVGPGDKRPVAAPDQHQRADLVVGGRARDGLAQLLEQLPVQRVERARAD